MARYHASRAHQGLGNERIEQAYPTGAGVVECTERSVVVVINAHLGPRTAPRQSLAPVPTPWHHVAVSRPPLGLARPLPPTCALEIMVMHRTRSAIATHIGAAFLVGAFSPVTFAQEWPGFRGPDRSGIAESASPPVEWSGTENIAWRTALPGAGASSPVVAGDRVFVTCYSGYGVDGDEPGEAKNLLRHLVCASRATGEILWDATLPSTAEEVGSRTQARDHGYATPTPITDGERVYVYFGRSGVLAFGIDGEELWRTRLATSAQGFPVSFAIDGEQYIAIPAGREGGSPWRIGSFLAPELISPTGHNALYVFKLN